MGDPQPPEYLDDWIDVSAQALPVARALAWAVVARCGGVVAFAGTVRDHAVDVRGRVRDGVTMLEYEAYEGPAVERMSELATEGRHRWPGLGRIVLLHRVGRLELEEVAVVVVVSAPHRGDAFDAARWCIDSLKATAPIWKKEEWSDGIAWGTAAVPIAQLTDIGGSHPGAASGVRS